MNDQSNDINEVWLDMLARILNHGTSAAPRGRKTREILHCMSSIEMTRPVLTVRNRRLGYKFLAAEAAWILSGDNRVHTISPYSRRIADFSDDGIYFFGAYGPQLVDQLSHVLRALKQDPESRHAVLTLWRPCPPQSKDIPCTIAVQFLIRPRHGTPTLHSTVTMRSSDIWLGWPYDVFNWSMVSGFVAACLQPSIPDLQLGSLHLVAASQHLYEDDIDKSRSCLNDGRRRFDYEPFDFTEFLENPTKLTDHLWALAQHEPTSQRWLFELLSL